MGICKLQVNDCKYSQLPDKNAAVSVTVDNNINRYQPLIQSTVAIEYLPCNY